MTDIGIMTGIGETDMRSRPRGGTSSRYASYDRIMGNISWLLIALVFLDIKLLPPAIPPPSTLPSSASYC